VGRGIVRERDFGRSAFLCAHLELTAEIREDHASYIASWIKVVKND
jgi:antirestriction protein ArdC